jgi:DNA-binding PadR family transcriptional regulator
MQPRQTTATDKLLPLTPAVFHILLALADADRHGYGIAQELAERIEGRVRLGPGTLYGTLVRMTEAGLVAEKEKSKAAKSAADERRRYYRITSFGREVARAEARRLANLVTVARAKALLAK